MAAIPGSWCRCGIPVIAPGGVNAVFRNCFGCENAVAEIVLRCPSDTARPARARRHVGGTGMLMANEREDFVAALPLLAVLARW